VNRTWGIAGGICGAIAVGAGAFGAHGLKTAISPEALTIFETAARYNMYHALAIVAAAIVAERSTSRAPRLAGLLFLIGIILFSGSLYAMALSDMKWRFLGAITPFGGLSMIIGWILLGVAAAARPSTNSAPTPHA